MTLKCIVYSPAKMGSFGGDVSIDTHIYGVFAYIHLMFFLGPNSDKPKNHKKSECMIYLPTFG